MERSNVHDRPGSLYTGLISAELECLPQASVIHHATSPETTAVLPLRGVLFNRGLVSLCDLRVNVVMPRRFDLADPDACPRCVEVVLAGIATRDGGPAEAPEH